jgi:ABC-type antimicrobial peptide transport system permease subunit
VTLSFRPERRVSEIGVRMALGANRGQVVRLVLAGACGLILFGLCIGLPSPVDALRAE